MGVRLVLVSKKEVALEVKVCPTKKLAGQAAAHAAAKLLREAIAAKGKAVFVAATGASMFDFLEALVTEPGIDWSKTEMFHLDEYVGISAEHPASFRRYLRERFVDKVSPGQVYWLQGDAPDIKAECARVGNLIRSKEVDVAFVGIGENGHLAFNDPPADFETEEPYVIVELDRKSREQQIREGWFASLDEVPRQAISMSVKQIMNSKHIVAIVPEKRKAWAVKQCLEGPVSPQLPASILRCHKNVQLFLDQESASLLDPSKGKEFIVT